MGNVKGICFIISLELLNHKKALVFVPVQGPYKINITAKNVLLMVMTPVNG